jgi:tetratricopeptide (TPR) repeat protein
LVHGELGALLLEVSRWEEARSELDQALKSACAFLGDNHPAVGVIASNFGGALEGLERFEDAREAVERSLAIGHAVLPDGHRNLWLRHRKLARILRALDDYEAARHHAEAAASISERALPAEDPEAARDQLALAALLQRMGEPASARGRYESALSVLEAAEDPSSPEIVGHQLTFGGLLIELGDLVAARSPLQSALTNAVAAEGNDSVLARIALLKLAERLAEELAATLELQGREAEAERVRDGDRESRKAVLNELIAEERIDSSLLAARGAGAAMPDLAGVALAQARTLAEAEEDVEEREQDLLAVRLTWSTLGLDAFMSADYEASRHFYETALELAAGDPTAEGEALNDLADIAGAEGDDARAVEIYREALARLRAGGGDEVEYTLLLLGRAHERLEQYEEAKACFLERLEILRAAGAPQPITEAMTIHDLASVHLARGEVELAIDLFGDAAELKRQTSNSGELAATLRALGGALREAGRVDEAADAYAECAQLLRDLPDSDPMTEAVVLQEFADLRRESGDLESAEDLYRRAISRALLEPDPLHLSFLLHGLAAVLQRRGDLPDAEAALRRRLEILAEVEGAGWQEGITLVDLGGVREESGDLVGAVGLYREAVAKLAPEDAPRVYGLALQSLGDVLTKSEELDRAVTAYQEAFDVWSAEGEPDLASRVLLDLGRAQYALSDFTAAAGSFEKRIDLLGQAAERNPRAEGFTLHDLADVRKTEGRLLEAISLYREAVARKRESEGDVELAASLTLLAITLMEAGEGQEVAALTEEAIAILCAEPDPNPFLLGSAIALSAFATPVDRGGLIAAGVERLRRLLEEGAASEAAEPLLEVLQTLGRKATADGNLGDAEGYFRERLSLLALQPDSGPNPLGITKHELARALGMAGKSDEAVALYREAAELKREASNGLGVARTNFALAVQLRKEKDEEAREVAARSVEQFRQQPNADPAELSAALALLALLEDDDQHALATLGEAKELVNSIPEDGAQTESARQGIARAEETIRRRNEQPG